MYKIIINYKKITENNQEYGQNDDSDFHSTNSSFYYEFIKNNDEISSENWETINIDYDPNKYKKLYLVYATYSTGDSFGHQAGAEIEFFDLYPDEEMANEAKKQIQFRSDEEQLCYVSSNGTGVKIGNPWNGHFESLDYINIEEFDVSELTKSQIKKHNKYKSEI